jgi:hypothetical protein
MSAENSAQRIKQTVRFIRALLSVNPTEDASVTVLKKSAENAASRQGAS